MLYITKETTPLDVQRKVTEIKSSAEWKSIEEAFNCWFKIGKNYKNIE